MTFSSGQGQVRSKSKCDLSMSCCISLESLGLDEHDGAFGFVLGQTRVIGDFRNRSNFEIYFSFCDVTSHLLYLCGVVQCVP